MLFASARLAKSNTGSGKITSRGDKEETDIFEMSKENILNGSPYSLLETHSGRGNPEAVRSKAGGDGKGIRAVLHPRKRSLSESRLYATPSTTRGRELSPPELTTSDNFKPAKRVLGPNSALDKKKKLPLVKVGLPPSPAAPSSARMVPRLSGPVDNGNLDSRSPKVGISTNKNNATTRKTSLTGRRVSFVRLSHSKEKGLSVSPKDAVKETTKKVMVFSAKKADQQTTPKDQKDLEKFRSRVVEKNAASSKSPVPSAKPPSKIVKAETVVKIESANKCRIVTHQSGGTKAICKNTKTRKLSVVLQSEQRLQEQNQQLELHLRELQEELLEKDNEIERLRSTGLILNNLAKNQSDEVRDLKLRLKETFNENVEVRDLCEKLEKERQEEHAAWMKAKEEELNNKALEIQLASLTSQIQNMGVGRSQSGNKLPCIELSQRTHDDQQKVAGRDDEVTVEEHTFEVHNEVQEDVSSKVDSDDSGSDALVGAGIGRRWNEPVEEVAEDVPVCRHPEVSPKQGISAVGNHEELLAAIRAVQELHDAEDSVLSGSMRNELEVIEDLLNALKVMSDLHPDARPTDQ